MIIEIKVPAPGESITEVELGDWLIEDGAVVELDDELVEINSDKATLTVVAEDDGKVSIKKQSGETVPVGEVIATIDTSVKPEGGSDKPAEKVAVANGNGEKQAVAVVEVRESTGHYAEGVAMPAADKLIREHGLDASKIKGTGKDGRITVGDVQNFMKQPQPEVKSNGKAAAAAESAAPAAKGQRGERREKMSTLRRKIAERLVSVKNETAMLTTFNEVDMSAIMDLRKKYKERFKEEHGVGLGFMSFFTKAVAEAIRSYPGINAQIDGEEIVYFDQVDMGIAVSTPRGLVVPVIRNVESMSLAEIEKAVMDYALKARDGKITIDDMTGGTFTITNGGVFGSMLSTPILNSPQSAILGMHNIVQRPVAVDGQVVIRPIMYVALSYDHRIVDGKESVSFLYKVKEMLEDPARMLLGF